MPVKKSGVAALFGAAWVSAAIMTAPAAVADECDPTASICQGPDIATDNSPPAAAPAPVPDPYPFDDEWYFNPAGGGTPLQPNHPSGGGGSGGGGHH